MSKEYFEENEKKDYELFEELMMDIAPTLTIGATPKYHYCDASAVTETNVIEYELKSRTYDFNETNRTIVDKNGKEYHEIFIEAQKATHLLFSHIHSNYTHLPKYVNFFETNGVKYAVCFDLLKMGLPEKKKYKIYSDGYESTEFGWRFLLPISKATIFKKDNNRYKRIQ